MKVCIIGSGLTSLTLAKKLINLGISIDIISNKKFKKNKTRTIGISRENINFFNQEILNIENHLWNINKIEIFSQNLDNEKILEFKDNKKSLFAIVKNDKLYEYLKSELIKNKLLRFINKLNIKEYKLVINCEKNNLLTKKYFNKILSKNYESIAYTTIFKHQKFIENYTAKQIFTTRGPLAFLPISSTETSVVYSYKGKDTIDLKEYIKKYGNIYSGVKIDKVEKFEIKSKNLRTYHYKNILAFGDLLHKLHPLAGQGFNMTIRDIKVLGKLIESKIENGLDLDNSICIDFEKKTKHVNYLFASGIDLIYEFFNLENKVKNKILSNSVRLIGKNKLINKTFKKYADNGIVI